MKLRVFKYTLLLLPVIKNIWNLFGIYILWIILHFICSNLYVKYCTPNTIIGFLSSPFITTLPQCQAFRWVIYNGGNSIMNMWLILGIWIMKYLVVITLTNVNVKMC
jgi:hypothetical protein